MSSLVVKPETMETLVGRWQIANKWTALSYSYSLRNAVGDDTYDNQPLPAASASGADQEFEKDVSPSDGGSYTGSGAGSACAGAKACKRSVQRPDASSSPGSGHLKR